MDEPSPLQPQLRLRPRPRHAVLQHLVAAGAWWRRRRRDGVHSSSRFRPTVTVLWAQEIFTTVNTYGKYVLGPDNILGGQNRERR
jgi:hypothetical protein